MEDNQRNLTPTQADSLEERITKLENQLASQKRTIGMELESLSKIFRKEEAILRQRIIDLEVKMVVLYQSLEEPEEERNRRQVIDMEDRESGYNKTPAWLMEDLEVQEAFLVDRGDEDDNKDGDGSDENCGEYTSNLEGFQSEVCDVLRKILTNDGLEGEKFVQEIIVALAGFPETGVTKRLFEIINKAGGSDNIRREIGKVIGMGAGKLKSGAKVKAEKKPKQSKSFWPPIDWWFKKGITLAFSLLNDIVIVAPDKISFISIFFSVVFSITLIGFLISMDWWENQTLGRKALWLKWKKNTAIIIIVLAIGIVGRWQWHKNSAKVNETSPGISATELSVKADSGSGGSDGELQSDPRYSLCDLSGPKSQGGQLTGKYELRLVNKNGISGEILVSSPGSENRSCVSSIVGFLTIKGPAGTYTITRPSGAEMAVQKDIVGVGGNLVDRQGDFNLYDKLKIHFPQKNIIQIFLK